MRNLCFVNSAAFWGGGEKLHFDYALRFSAKGYKVVVVSRPNSPLLVKAAAQGLRTYALGLGRRSVLNPLAIARLYGVFVRERIDTALFTVPDDLRDGGPTARLAGVERIAYLRESALAVKRSLLNKWLLTRIVTHIVANSHETRRLLRTNLQDVLNGKRVKVIYHGIDLKEYDEPFEHVPIHRAPGEIILGHAGRLTEQKGQDHLIALAARLRQEGWRFKIVIAGTGKLDGELKAAVKAQGLEEHVMFLGFVPDIRSFMRDIDVFVLPSLWEGFGFVIVEAMAARKPVVAFRVSSNPEVIRDGDSGLLADAGDPDDLYQQVRRLMADETLRNRMGENARRHVEQHFEVHAKVDELEEYLRAAQ